MSQNDDVRVPTRRALVRGAAWSVPVLAVAAAAPAVAASGEPPRGLEGVVLLTRQGCELSIDGRGDFTGGSPGDRGFWTVAAGGRPDITGAVLTFYVSRSDLTFGGGGPGWSALVRDPGLDDRSPAAGHVAYTTTYAGGWTFHPAHRAWTADGQPRFTALMARQCGHAVTAYDRRTLTVDGRTVTTSVPLGSF